MLRKEISPDNLSIITGVLLGVVLYPVIGAAVGAISNEFDEPVISWLAITLLVSISVLVNVLLYSLFVVLGLRNWTGALVKSITITIVINTFAFAAILMRGMFL